MVHVPASQDLDPVGPAAAIAADVARWLAEDIGRGDVTTHAVVPPDRLGRARIEARSDAVVAGLPIAAEIFRQASGGELKWVPEVEEGTLVSAGAVVARVEGSLHGILLGERTALNILQRLCGIAAQARALVGSITGTRAAIVDTRKTTPGLRLYEKYAVRVGGGSNHRFGLDDAILVKDNHIAAVGSVAEATRRARQNAPHGLKVEIEVTDIAGLEAAIGNGADTVMLDNMSVEEVQAAVEVTAGRVTLEVSGGITQSNVRAYAETGVDLISVGALTHSVPAADLALEVEL